MKIKIIKTGAAFTNSEGRVVAPPKDTHVDVDDALGQGLLDAGMAEAVKQEEGQQEDLTSAQPVEGQAAAPNATEAAEREAQERGVDLAQVDGTGADGRITQSDVIQYAKAQEERESSRPSETTASAGPEETR